MRGKPPKGRPPLSRFPAQPPGVCETNVPFGRAFAMQTRDTALQPLIWHSESWSSHMYYSPEECFFLADNGLTQIRSIRLVDHGAVAFSMLVAPPGTCDQFSSDCDPDRFYDMGTRELRPAEDLCGMREGAVQCQSSRRNILEHASASRHFRSSESPRDQIQTVSIRCLRWGVGRDVKLPSSQRSVAPWCIGAHVHTLPPSS